jgi:hypothetical protein
MASAAEIINYPKQHSRTARSSTRRRKLVYRRAPSYYIEGQPAVQRAEGKSSGCRNSDTIAAINWMRNKDRSKFVCANEQYYLLGNSAVQWPAANCWMLP